MRYMFLMYGAEDAWTDAERRDCMAKSLAVIDRLAAEGKFVDASPLQPVTTAETVRVRDGRPVITDGPFAETREVLGGYFILELADLDEAIAVAGRLPQVHKGTVEIRPTLPLDGLPPSKQVAAEPTGPALSPFLLLCHDDEAAWQAAGPETLRAAMTEAAGLARELNDAGRYLSASPLHPAATATSVRERYGKRVVPDGPFAETREVLGGYYLVLAASREEALGFAARHPGARFGSVEVRPLFDLPGFRKSLLESRSGVDSGAARSTP